MNLLKARQHRATGATGAAGVGGRPMTTTIGVSHGPVTPRASGPTCLVAAPPGRGGRPPARIRLLLALLILLSLAWGVLAALNGLTSTPRRRRTWFAVSEPLSLDAEQIYTSLSDADATAANAFLACAAWSLLRPGSATRRTSPRRPSGSRRPAPWSGRPPRGHQLPGHLTKQASAAGTAVGGRPGHLVRSASRLHRRGGHGAGRQPPRASARRGLPQGGLRAAARDAAPRGQ